jgi:hypothetical protein
MSADLVFVGIDVVQFTLEVAVQPTSEDWQMLRTWLRSSPPVATR